MNTTPSLPTGSVPSHRDLPLHQLAFSPLEVAVMLGLKPTDSEGGRAVRRLIQSGKLRARQTGARYMIPGDAVREYLEGNDEPIKHPESA